MPENPFQSPIHGGQKTNLDQEQSATPGNAAYNVVTDTVTGVNVRWSDNKFQAIFVLVSMVVAALAGSVLVLMNAGWEMPWYVGALTGAFAGLVIGLFASGIFLMFYRAARHIKGKHD